MRSFDHTKRKTNSKIQNCHSKNRLADDHSEDVILSIERVSARSQKCHFKRNYNCLYNCIGFDTKSLKTKDQRQREQRQKKIYNIFHWPNDATKH